MEWDESLSVGVAVIDEQHQKLVGMLNRLSWAMEREEGDKVLGGILEELRDYMGYHFSTEEDYFEEFDYGLADEHKRQHREFAGKVVSFIEDFEKGKASMSGEVLEFLTGWLEEHVNDSDKKYVQCFHENGLE